MFCSKCGAENKEQSRFCQGCGVQLGHADEAQPEASPAPEVNAQAAAQPNAASAQQTAPPPPPPPMGQPVYPAMQADESTCTVFKVISYLGILWLLGLLIAPYKEDDSVRFHVGQGMLLSIFMVAGNIVISIISGIFRAISGSIGMYIFSPFSLISALLQLAFWGVTVFFVVYGIVKAVKKENVPLPIIGQFAFYK